MTPFEIYGFDPEEYDLYFNSNILEEDPGGRIRLADLPGSIPLVFIRKLKWEPNEQAAQP